MKLSDLRKKRGLRARNNHDAVDEEDDATNPKAALVELIVAAAVAPAPAGASVEQLARQAQEAARSAASGKLKFMRPAGNKEQGTFMFSEEMMFISCLAFAISLSETAEERRDGRARLMQLPAPQDLFDHIHCVKHGVQLMHFV